MIFQLDNPYDVQKARDWLENAIEKKWNISQTHLLPKRTDRQNRYLHAILGYFGAVHGLTMEEVKVSVFKDMVNHDMFYLGTVVIGGVEQVHWKSTKSLTTGEMTTAIERFRNFSASVAGLYLSSPEDEQFILYCEQQIDNNKEFI